MALAREVISGETQIDDEENHIDEECLKMLALHQPVAVDLRRITAAMMIIVDLERMGDLAEEIAERAIELARPPYFPIPERLQRMTDLTTTMVRQSLDAFVNLDVHLARVVYRLDDEVDDYCGQIITDLVQTMKRAGPDRGGPVAVLGDAAPGTDRRPRYQHCRRRYLSGRRRDRAPPPPRGRGPVK